MTASNADKFHYTEINPEW